VIFIASITPHLQCQSACSLRRFYMLSDYLEIPNLQMKSREYLMGLIKVTSGA